MKLPLVSSPSKSRGRGGGFRSKSPSSRNSRRSASPSRGGSASPSKRRGKPASITQLRKESPFAIPDDDAVVIERRKEIDDAKLLRRQARRTGGNGNATASLSATNTASLARSQSQSRRIESPSRRRTRRAEEASSDGGFMVLDRRLVIRGPSSGVRNFITMTDVCMGLEFLVSNRQDRLHSLICNLGDKTKTIGNIASAIKSIYLEEKGMDLEIIELSNDRSETRNLDFRSSVLADMGYQWSSNFRQELIELVNFCEFEFGERNEN